MVNFLTAVSALSLLQIHLARGFGSIDFRPSAQAATKRTSPLGALTERQLQFWEDVETGLADIESFYEKKGLSIDRIKQFTQRLDHIRIFKLFCQLFISHFLFPSLLFMFWVSAQGKAPPPTGYAEGHDPSEEHVEGLTAKPFWNAAAETELFPWAAKLEEQSHIIQEEFDQKLREADQFASDSVWQNQVMGGGWSAIRLQRLGVWVRRLICTEQKSFMYSLSNHLHVITISIQKNAENCEEFPKTYELLRSLKIPLAVRGVCFARQSPGSGVQPHSDGRNFILTSHLGLKIPEGCWIEVGGERKGWEEGKLTTLDTSFTHSTGNPSESDRHVLIVDFWHPELTDAERAALDFVYDLRNKFESGLVPFRRPRSAEPEGEGLAGLFSGLWSGGK